MVRARYYDLLIRAAGLTLFASAAATLARLFHDPAAAHGDAGWPQALATTWGVIGGSGGAALVVLGRHVHDRIPVSARWAAAERPARED